MVRLIGERSMNRIVSHLENVKAEVDSEARKIGTKARARLASHRKTGQAKVTVSHGEVDSFVNLEDPAALSIEFGHFVKGRFGDEDGEPKYVPGLYIVTGAAGLLD